ncbi:MAG: diaminopimelate dehydrogenase [Candidatus Atribacteria bacterium]|nr:diaminopimelate dehydrogenase [Candidatus Atribacteria bacterium]
MYKSRVIIVGFGHVGRGVLDALYESPDMEIAGIVELPHNIKKIKEEVRNIPLIENDIKKLGKIDVAILAISSRKVPEIAPIYLQQGINTVDAYDIHGESLIKLREDLGDMAKKYKAVSIVAAGWDPGSDSMIRAILEINAPKGITYVNYGPGMSLGHTVAVKSIEGIDDAISLTIPKGVGMHRRLVYVKMKNGYDLENISNKIKNDSYFIHDEVHVVKVDNIGGLLDMGHAVKIERKGVSGKTHNQRMEYTVSVNNPAVTGQVMVSAARASLKQKPGCYSVLEIPPIDFFYGEKQEILSRLI